MTSWILIAALATQSYVCEVDGKRRVSYRPIPGCESRVISIDSETSPAVPLFLPGEPTLTDTEKERLDRWRADPQRRGVCVVRVNPAAFDADVITTEIDGKQLKFQIWTNSPGADDTWSFKGVPGMEEMDAWTGNHASPQGHGRLRVSREQKTPQAIYVHLGYGLRRLEVDPLFVGGEHLVLTDYKPSLDQPHGPPLGRYAVDPAKQAQLDRTLLRKFPDEATYARLRASGDAVARDSVAHAPDVSDAAAFASMYGPYLPRLKRIWAGAPPGFIDPDPGAIVDTRTLVTLDRPCTW